jgi:transposase
VPGRARTTTRLREQLATAVEDGRSQAEVAATFGGSWPTVQRPWSRTAVGCSASRSLRRCPGLDEVRFGRPRWCRGADGRWTRTDPWETRFVDLLGGQGLLGQVDGRTTAAVRDWLAASGGEFRDTVHTVRIDPHAGYARAVREQSRSRGSRSTTSS